MIGLATFIIRMFSYMKLEATPVVEEAHVLILVPSLVPLKVQSFTVTPTTLSVTLPSPPILPTLIPCPGPQWTWEILMFLLPESIATQSSPVPILVLEILISSELPILIPSVLGLSPGADSLRLDMFKLTHPKSDIWAFWLLIDLIWLTIPFWINSSLNDWSKI